MKIAIIGGGAAGFFAANSSAEHNNSAEISIIEASSNFLSKVLISGGGRCNVTNNTLDPSELVKNYPRGHKELRGPFSEFNVNNTIHWFESRGVKLKAEPDGRMFPITDNSQTIADCLLNTARAKGVKLKTNHKVIRLERFQENNINKFKLHLWRGESLVADRLILTTGGNKSSYDLAESLGHKIEKPVPSLFSFEINAPALTDLQGVSFKRVSLELITPCGKKFKQTGSILITHWGLSGPAIIKLSALAALELFNSNYRADLRINFLDSLPTESAFKILKDLKEAKVVRHLQNENCFDLPKSFWLLALEESGLPASLPANQASDKSLRLLAENLTRLNLKIAGKGKFKDEFVTCGGVALNEVNFKTMESKICPGLFFAGEILNIDGLTGGFNFQNAWTTGWIAGRSQAQ